MARRKLAPFEVQARHSTLLAAAALEVDAKREDAWQAELALRAAIRAARKDNVTSGPIREATGLSIPRIYQIERDENDEQPPLYQPRGKRSAQPSTPS